MNKSCRWRWADVGVLDWQGATLAVLVMAMLGAACTCGPGPKDTTPPTWLPDAALRASSVTPTFATLSWPAASDASPPVRYRLSRNGAVVSESSALSLDVTGLHLGAGEVFKVEAGDSFDNWTSNGPEADVAGAPPTPKAPPLDLTDVVKQDEFTHDVLIVLSDGYWLVYGTT